MRGGGITISLLILGSKKNEVSVLDAFWGFFLTGISPSSAFLIPVNGTLVKLEVM